MGADLLHTMDAIRWATDYLHKPTSVAGFVFTQVGDPHAYHECWECPEDMDTPRTTYAVSKDFPGSNKVSGEIVATLAAASLVFRPVDRQYSARLLKRARMVFGFANEYRGSYNESLGTWVFPFYCDFGGYEDELLWAATWLTKAPLDWDHVGQNIKNIIPGWKFGWEAKDPGIYVLVSKS